MEQQPIDGIHFHCPIIINYHPQLNATPQLGGVGGWLGANASTLDTTISTSVFIQAIDPSTSEPVVIVIEPLPPSSSSFMSKGLMVDQRRTGPAQ